MTSALLATKFHQPALSARWVSRPHLTRRLNEGLAQGRRLTLVSAPAGFGKSTCVGEWVSGLNCPVSWLSLDASDDDPVRFFTYFIAALQRVHPALGQDIIGTLYAGQAPTSEAIVTTLVNDLIAVPERFVLVLDDFQMIQERAILEPLGRLAAALPQPMHLALVTREDPLLPLARLRANDQMTEIRAADLRFTPAETSCFLIERMGLALTEADIEALENRTEGWAAGLQLAGLSMRDRPDPARFIANLSGSHRHILGYLTEEVLGRQSAEVQDFLLKTSVLESLTGDLCDAVTGTTGSDALLERLYHANLFLSPLDDELRWYRYHHLFADLLRSQQARLGKEGVAELHRRASAWFSRAGQPVEAIRHALDTEDYALAVSLLERHAMPILLQGYAHTVEGWSERIPEQWQLRAPRLNLAFSWMHLLRGSYDRIGPYTQRITQAMRALDPNDEGARQMRAEWLALQSNLMSISGKPEEALTLAEQALELCAPDDLYARGLAHLGQGGAYRLLGNYDELCRAYLSAAQYSHTVGNQLAQMISVAVLMLMSVQFGRLRFAVEIGAPVVERLNQAGEATPPIAATVYGSVGIVYFEWNQLEPAYRLFQRSKQLSEISGHNAGSVYSHMILSRYCMASGDLEAAHQHARSAADLAREGVPAWLRPEVGYQQVRVYLARKEPDLAEASLKANRLPFANAPAILPALWLDFAALRLALYRVVEEGHTDQAPECLALAERLAQDALRQGRMGAALQALLLRAQARNAAGESEAALADLEQALEIGEPEGYIRSFVDEGPALAGLLRRALPRTAFPAYLKQVLAAFPAVAAAEGENGLVEALTARELEVLRLIAEGLKYEEIAARLVITVNTVRFYVKEIYGKLNVNSRGQAVEMARRLDLL